MIRVLIADDHAIVRQGMRQVLTEDGGMVVAGEAADGAAVLDLVREGGIDVVVMDITMPGRSGLEVLKDLHAEFPALPVLILSMHAEEQYAVRVLRAGAAGYLTKGSAPDELLSAIRRIHSGRRYISAAVAEQLADELDRGTDDEPHTQLSDREFQVFIGLARGRTLTEMANEMFLSVKTVSTYRTRVLEKLRVRTNAELTTYALEHGLH